MRRGLAKNSGALAVGTLANGVLAYVFFALATRTLGAEAAAPVSVLWTYWTIVTAVITFPLQHWIIRSLAADDHENNVARAMPRVWLATAGVAALSVAVAYQTRATLFSSRSLVFPLVVGAVTFGACLTGLVRGGLAGRGRFVSTGYAMAAENIVRVALGIVVAVAFRTAPAFALVLAAGPLVGLVWHRSLRFERSAEAAGSTSPAGIASGLAAGSLIAQLVLTGGPVVLAAIGGAPAQITSLFVAMALWRAPYLLSLGLATQVTGVFTRLVLQDDAAAINRIRRWLLVGVVAAAAAGAAGSALLGEDILRLVFGPEITIGPLIVALVGVGTVVAIGNLLLLLLLVARGATRSATVGWLCALAVAAAWLLLSPAPPPLRVAQAFVAAEVVAAAIMAFGEVSAGRRGPAAAAPPVTEPLPTA